MRKIKVHEGISYPICKSAEGQMSGGSNASGSKRYFCKMCKKWYTPVPTKWAYTEAECKQGIKMILDDCTGRGIGRQLQMSKANAYRWAAEAQKNGVIDVDKP